MNGLNIFFKDSYFWIEVGLFFSSLIGAIWILKSLQKESTPKPLPLTNKPDTKDQKKDSQTASNLPDPLPENQMKDKKATLETLSGKMDHIEETLSKIDQKLDQLSLKQLCELSQNIQTIIQALKSKEKDDEKDLLIQLSSKVDKITQILGLLFRTEKK